MTEASASPASDTVVERLAKRAVELGLCRFNTLGHFRALLCRDEATDGAAIPELVNAGLLVHCVAESKPAPAGGTESWMTTTWWLAERLTGPFVWTAQVAAAAASWILPIQRASASRPALTAAAAAEEPAVSEKRVPDQSSVRSSEQKEGASGNEDAYSRKPPSAETDVEVAELAQAPDAEDLHPEYVPLEAEEPIIFIPAVHRMVVLIAARQAEADAMHSVFTLDEWTDTLVVNFNIRHPDVVTEFMLRHCGVLVPITEPQSGARGLLFTKESSQAIIDDAIVVLRFKSLRETVSRAVAEWKAEVQELLDFSETNTGGSVHARREELLAAIEANELFHVELEKRFRRLTSPLAPAITGTFPPLVEYINELLEQFPGDWPQPPSLPAK